MSASAELLVLSIASKFGKRGEDFYPSTTISCLEAALSDGSAVVEEWTPQSALLLSTCYETASIIIHRSADYTVTGQFWLE